MKRSKFSFHDFSAKHTPSATLTSCVNLRQIGKIRPTIDSDGVHPDQVPCRPPGIRPPDLSIQSAGRRYVNIPVSHKSTAGDFIDIVTAI